MEAAAAACEEYFGAEEGFDTAADTDEALLRELLEEEEEEDAAAAANDDDSLGSVIRPFLDSEISRGGGEDAADDDEMVADLDPVHRREECEECRLDDILAAGSDGHGCSTASSEYEQGEENFGWVESPCSEMEWLVEEYCADELVWGTGSALCCSEETCLIDEQQ